MLSNFHSQRSTQKQKEAPPFRVRVRHFRFGFMLFLHEPTSHNDDNSDNDNDDADDSYSQRAQRLWAQAELDKQNAHSLTLSRSRLGLINDAYKCGHTSGQANCVFHFRKYLHFIIY